MIKNWKQFNEAISGTELLGSFGPGTEMSNKKITSDMVGDEIIYSELTGILYTQDDYNILYNEYLKKGGTPLIGFNKENLETIITFN